MSDEQTHIEYPRKAPQFEGKAKWLLAILFWSWLLFVLGGFAINVLSEHPKAPYCDYEGRISPAQIEVLRKLFTPGLFLIPFAVFWFPMAARTVLSGQFPPEGTRMLGNKDYIYNSKARFTGLAMLLGTLILPLWFLDLNATYKKEIDNIELHQRLCDLGVK